MGRGLRRGCLSSNTARPLGGSISMVQISKEEEAWTSTLCHQATIPSRSLNRPMLGEKINVPQQPTPMLNFF